MSENKNKYKTITGIFLIFFSALVFISMTSFLFNWQVDQSELDEIISSTEDIQNFGKKIGLIISNLLIFKGFGIGSFVFPLLFSFYGLSLLINSFTKKLIDISINALVICVWTSISLSYLIENKIFGGVFGYEIHIILLEYIGDLGLILLLLFVLFSFIILNFNVNFKNFLESLKKTKTVNNDEKITVDEENSKNVSFNKNIITDEEIKPTISNFSKLEENSEENSPTQDSKIEIEIEESKQEEIVDVNNLPDYDQKLDLGSFIKPKIDLLIEHDSTGAIKIDENELKKNKDKIEETLLNYKIEIKSIKATIGPTVTLYEIVPEAGVRISKIKNLEDDIALSLSALGIRIIAPMPGKGTIGIEVPNESPKIVSIKSLLSSKKFQDAEMEIPLALGKTISNETFVVDLTKMPHLLVAGATGQGKSVGINSILTSIIYKKHPADVKFVLVDPKKVELTLFNKIEKHYLAKLPEVNDSIITDSKIAVKTLKSLCKEMDNRYEMLKNAKCRNIKEYNQKFKKRVLSPRDGHKYIPYLVLIIDEFADLIMTTGKEVETNIARLAQMARAVGIHLVLATQRPSVNVITGLIKANIPARISFRVTSKIDSRTILDSSGAEQLIGRGDMLFSQGSDLTRLQCGFVDTPEIEKMVAFVGNQIGYTTPYILPEIIDQETSISSDNDISERDPLFKEAAEIIVSAQQGSASLLQRKMKLGYNRAGRIIDQLEAAGIVGPFEGSKARSVNVKDLIDLDDYLK